MLLNELFEKAAYHGSPHDFASFDTDYIGTGEGNSTYGWGLYFAETKAVADKYSNDIAEAGHFFTKKGQEVKQPELIATATKLVQAAVAKGFPNPSYDYEGREITCSETALHNMELLLKRGSGTRMVTYLKTDAKYHDTETAAFYKIIAAFFSRLEWREGRGKVYHVDISDTSSFLDWMADMDQQPEPVKAVAAQFNYEGDGHDFYRWLAQTKGGEKAASVYLLKNGVEGIRYPDRGSRKSETPAYNYVVFNHNLVTISKAE